MLTVKELEEHAEAFLQKNFGRGLNIPIQFNGRLLTTMGRFRTQSNEALDIEIAKFVIEHNADKLVLDVLYHECVHYALYEKDVPFTDEDQNFTDKCIELGVILTRTTIPVQMKHHYTCDCKTDFEFKFRTRVNARCKACKQPLTYVGYKLDTPNK